MSEGEKLHRLLEFIAKTGEKSYSYEDLIPAFNYGVFKKPNEKEIERLCAILINDELVVDAPDKKSGGINVKPQAVAAYYANKYFQEEEQPKYSGTAILRVVGMVGLIAVGFLWVGYVTYSRGLKLKSAKENLQQDSVRDLNRLKQIESLTASRDSLRNLVKALRVENENLKKPVEKKPTPAKPKRKKK